MNFYAFHIGDYATATRHLTWDEDAAYRRLLDAYYIREAPLPADKQQVYRLVMATSRVQRAAVDTVLAEFFTMVDDGYFNARCNEEIGATAVKRDKAKQSAELRWEKERNAKAMRTHSDGNAPTPSKVEEKNNLTVVPKEPEKVASKSKPKVGTRLPDDFLPDDSCFRVAEKLHLSSDDVQLELDRFVDRNKGVPGQRGVSLDWQASFRYWLRNSLNFNGKTNGKPKSETIQRITGGVSDIIQQQYREALEADEGKRRGQQGFPRVS